MTTEGSIVISVDLKQEAFRQKILSAAGLVSASIANYTLSGEWERSALRDELAAEYVLVRSQLEYALQESSPLFPGERQALAFFKDRLEDAGEVLYLVKP